MDNALEIVGLVSAVVFVAILIYALWTIHRSKQKKHQARFQKSSAPVAPEMEVTQKVRSEKDSPRPVIRNTQFRGRSRRKF